MLIEVWYRAARSVVWRSGEASGPGGQRGEQAMAVHPALIGKAGEMMVAAELMRRGVEVAQPHSDVGVDLLAYRLEPGSTVPNRIVPVQVKSASKVAFDFHKKWLTKSANLVLAWRLETTPEFYVFDTVSG